MFLTQDLDPLQTESTPPSIGEPWRVSWSLVWLHPCSKTPKKLNIIYLGIIHSLSKDSPFRYLSAWLPFLHLSLWSQSSLSFVWSLQSCLHWWLGAQQRIRSVLCQEKHFHQTRCCKVKCWHLHMLHEIRYLSSGALSCQPIVINFKAHQCFYLYIYLDYFLIPRACCYVNFPQREVDKCPWCQTRHWSQTKERILHLSWSTKLLLVEVWVKGLFIEIWITQRQVSHQKA